MKISYSHLIKRIKSKPSIDKISSNLLQLGHEHEITDGIFDIELTPNRGDCLSLNGILRDLSLFHEIDFIYKKYEGEIGNLKFKFNNHASNDCPSISFLYIEIDSAVSEYQGPLKDYFDELDNTKINFFTDVSNFISYETGQPTHCYDFELLGNSLRLDYTKNEQAFETITNKKIKIDKNELVFFNSNDEVVNLAGVMGGKKTECNHNTKRVLIECAFFNPEKIIGRTVKYDLVSDAAHKFERSVDVCCHEDVLRRFIEIVNQHVPVSKIELLKNNQQTQEPKLLEFNVNIINKILGINLNNKEYSLILSKLGFIVDDDEIIVPSYRSDVNSQNDLAEEVARAIGYDNIPAQDIHIANSPLTSNNKNIENLIKNSLYKEGFHEVINNPFESACSKKSIQVDNPLDSNKKFLRSNLKNYLINNLLYNEKRQHESIKLFEISDIYEKSNDGIAKKRIMGIIASGRVANNYKDFQSKIDLNYMNDIFQSIQSEANIKLTFEHVSRNNLDSKIKNEIVYTEVELVKTNNEKKSIKKISTDYFIFPKYNRISEYPSSKRDLSFLIKDSSEFKIFEDLILNFKNELLKEVFVFDFYVTPEKHIKVGFRFIFQSKISTLTDKQVNNQINEIITITNSFKSISIPGLN